MKPKISILLPCYKSEMLFCKIFNSGWRRNTVEDVELVVYNNGGNGNTFLSYIYGAAHLWEDPNLTFQYIPGASRIVKLSAYERKVVEDGENVGLNAALNECAKIAQGEWFYLPHTDMYLMPGWDTALLEAVKNQPPGTQLLCSRSIEPTKGHTDFHIIKNYGMEWNEFDKDKLLEDFSEYSDKTICTGYRMPFFLHRSLWERMNGVDSNYFSYCTDDDLVQTAYDVGVRRFWMVYGSLVYHLQGKSNQQQTVDKDSDKPYIYFINKWKEKGYKDAHHPGQWHPKLIPNYTRIR